jgi:hypothetical protein
MKTKVKKYFITYLSLVLILSNFSFATTLALCEMDGSKYQCCTDKNDMGKYGPSIRNIPYNCCETKVVELTNSNILEVLHNTTVNPIAQVNLLSPGTDGLCSVSVNACNFHYDLSFHPPNSEIPILNSSLLI